MSRRKGTEGAGSSTYRVSSSPSKWYTSSTLRALHQARGMSSGLSLLASRSELNRLAESESRSRMCVCGAVCPSALSGFADALGWTCAHSINKDQGGEVGRESSLDALDALLQHHLVLRVAPEHENTKRGHGRTCMRRGALGRRRGWCERESTRPSVLPTRWATASVLPAAIIVIARHEAS